MADEVMTARELFALIQRLSDEFHAKPLQEQKMILEKNKFFHCDAAV